MDYDFYLEKFNKSADRLDKKLLNEKRLHVHVGITLNSVCLKLYKKEWANDWNDPVNAKTRIFFSVWINDKTIQEKKIFYNIHALKLRHLKGYSITSRNFADNFRKDFKKFQPQWENVSIKFGPLTLMEGWENLEVENLEGIVASLAENFIAIDYLIDNTLKLFEKV